MKIPVFPTSLKLRAVKIRDRQDLRSFFSSPPKVKRRHCSRISCAISGSPRSAASRSSAYRCWNSNEVADFFKQCHEAFYFRALQKCAIIVRLEECCKMNSDFKHDLQTLASIEPRTSPFISQVRALGNLNFNFEISNRLFATQVTLCSFVASPWSTRA